MTKTIKPQAGPQELFLTCPADIVIYGGGAGGGKTFGLLLDPVRYIKNGRFNSLIFRRTFAQVTQEGGMWDETYNLYPHLGAKPNQQHLRWKFPSGASITFAHLQQEQNKYSYDGAQIANLSFDQLEHFTETMFFYMLIRNRSVSGIRPYCRATCNPSPDSWLANLIDWWIGEDGYIIPERSGQIRYFVRKSEKIIWADRPEQIVENHPDVEPIDVKSFTFIMSTVYDNKILLETNPEYLANLRNQDYLEYMRLLGEGRRGGNWKVKPAAGLIFNKSDFKIVETTPTGGEIIIFADFAATVPNPENKNPDYSAVVLLQYVHGRLYFLDSTAWRSDVATTEQRFLNLVEQGARTARRKHAVYKVRWELEPGAAAIRDAQRLTALLGGYDAEGIRPDGNKIRRSRPLAAQSRAGNVYLLEGAWNDEWINHMHNQPELDHDDTADASTGAANEVLPMGSAGFDLAG